MTLYILGIGGTGTKCIEAVIHLAAVGLLNKNQFETIKVLFIDPDKSNGSLERAKQTLSTYEECINLRQNNTSDKSDKSDNPWMRTKVEILSSADPWSPLESGQTNHKNLGSLFHSSRLQNSTTSSKKLGYLFDILYAQEAQTAKLDIGFRGRPAIGAAVMNHMIDPASEPWKTLIDNLKDDADNNRSPKVCLCGSLFGGTGASGLPTIGRWVATKLGENRKNVEIASIFMLPYFQFRPPEGEAQAELCADPKDFLPNTAAALHYYHSQAQIILGSNDNSTFNVVYLLGNEKLSQVGDHHLGHKAQDNPPHFLELYAGLAIRDFIHNSSKLSGEKIKIIGCENGEVNWRDLPNLSDKKDEVNEVKALLVNPVKLCYIWTNMAIELRTARKAKIQIAQKLIPWITLFFKQFFGDDGEVVFQLLRFIGNSKGEKLPNLESEENDDASEKMNGWCKDYLKWLLALQRCDPNVMPVKLFKEDGLNKLLNHVNSNEVDNNLDLKMSDLIYGENESQGLFQELRRELNSANKNHDFVKGSGVIGLFEAIYSFIVVLQEPNQ